jgi:hypothetical protein
MKGIQNKKFLGNCHTCIRFMLSEKRAQFFHAWLMPMCQLVTFGELSNDVDTTGTGSVRVVASKVAISYGFHRHFRMQYGHQPPTQKRIQF